MLVILSPLQSLPVRSALFYMNTQKLKHRQQLKDQSLTVSHAWEKLGSFSLALWPLSVFCRWFSVSQTSPSMLAPFVFLILQYLEAQHMEAVGSVIIGNLASRSISFLTLMDTFLNLTAPIVQRMLVQRKLLTWSFCLERQSVLLEGACIWNHRSWRATKAGIYSKGNILMSASIFQPRHIQ